MSSPLKDLQALILIINFADHAQINKMMLDYPKWPGSYCTYSACCSDNVIKTCSNLFAFL